MTEDQWKRQSKPLYMRLIALHDRASDNGLTDAEKAEVNRLTDEVGRLFMAYVQSQFSRRKHPS